MNSFAGWYESARKTFRPRARGAGPIQGRGQHPLAAEGEQVPGHSVTERQQRGGQPGEEQQVLTPTHLAPTYGRTRLKISSVPSAFAASNGRPPVAQQIRDLVLCLAVENPS